MTSHHELYLGRTTHSSNVFILSSQVKNVCKWFEGFCTKAAVRLKHSLLRARKLFGELRLWFWASAVLEVEDYLCQRDLLVGSLIVVDHGTKATQV